MSIKKSAFLPVLEEPIYEWNLQNMSDDNKTYQAVSSGYGIALSDDGKHLYVGAGTVLYQYTMSTAWDISTCSFTRSVGFGYTGGGIWLSPDGTKLMVARSSTYAMEHTLSTPFDISTMTTTYTFNTGSSGAQAVCCNREGTRFYYMNYNEYIRHYELTTPFSLATAVYKQQIRNTAQSIKSAGILISPTGLRFFYSAYNTRSIYQYNMASQWNFPITYTGINKSAGYNMFWFKPDGTKLYWNNGGGLIRQFTVS